jgi:hypothetical protein
MALLPVDPNLINVTTITTAQTVNPLGAAWLVTQDFATWVDTNQPNSFGIYGGGIWIDIPDWNTPVIIDYLSSWPMPY